jgi:hypothetical protein
MLTAGKHEQAEMTTMVATITDLQNATAGLSRHGNKPNGQTATFQVRD